MATQSDNNYQLPKNETSRKIIDGYYRAYFGRTPSLPEQEMWYGKGTRELERALLKNTQNIYGAGKGSRVTIVDPRAGTVKTTFSVKPVLTKPASSPSGTSVTMKAPPKPIIPRAVAPAPINTSDLKHIGDQRKQDAMRNLSYAWEDGVGYVLRKPGRVDIPGPLNEILDQLEIQLDGIIAKGEQPLPDIEITPEIAAGFLEQAKIEMDPYYQRITDDAITDLKTNFSRNLKLQEQQEADYTRGVEDTYDEIAAGSAERGLTFSGRRQESERKLAEQANRDVGRSRDSLRFGMGESVLAGERFLGSEALGQGLGASQGLARPTFIAGQREAEFGEEQPLYSLSDGIEGSLERSKLVSEKQRASELETAYRAKRSLLLQ